MIAKYTENQDLLLNYDLTLTRVVKRSSHSWIQKRNAVNIDTQFTENLNECRTWMGISAFLKFILWYV